MNTDILISIPFGCEVEERRSGRYFWDSRDRGKEPFVILQRTISGEGFFRHGDFLHRVPPEHALIAIPPEDSSYGCPVPLKKAWRFSWINFYGEMAVELFTRFRAARGSVLPLRAKSEEGILYRHLLEMSLPGKRPSPHKLSAMAFEFLMDWAASLEEPEKKSDPVETALRVCESRFREPLGIKELAAASGLSREHFTRIFSEKVGISPAQHLRALRIQAARTILDKTSRTEAARRCGFPSVRALNRALEAEQHFATGGS